MNSPKGYPLEVKLPTERQVKRRKTTGITQLISGMHYVYRIETTNLFLIHDTLPVGGDVSSLIDGQSLVSGKKELIKENTGGGQRGLCIRGSHIHSFS